MRSRCRFRGAGAARSKCDGHPQRAAERGGNQAFKFIKKQDFHDKKGELRYKVKKGDAIVQGDVNGDGKADFSIHVDNVSKLKASDFDL